MLPARTPALRRSGLRLQLRHPYPTPRQSVMRGLGPHAIRPDDPPVVGHGTQNRVTAKWSRSSATGCFAGGPPSLAICQLRSSICRQPGRREKGQRRKAKVRKGEPSPVPCILDYGLYQSPPDRSPRRSTAEVGNLELGTDYRSGTKPAQRTGIPGGKDRELVHASRTGGQKNLL